MRSLNTCLAVCATLFTAIETLTAAPADHQLVRSPGAGPNRPQLPARFDEQTVRQMVADIDKPYSASLLKVGYFLRRGRPEFPIAQGFALLEAAAEREPVATRRWFLLQGLRAFVAFRVADVSTEKGFAAYEAIFAHAAEAAKARSLYPLRQAIAEFVSGVSGKFKELGLATDERTKETLLKAWTAYVLTVSAPSVAASRAPEPDWNVAIQSVGASEAFLTEAEKVLADTAIPKGFGILFAAATIVASKDPAKAVSLLQQAKPLVPKKKGKLEINQAARFYDTLVDLLAAQNNLTAAITAQEERSRLLGDGQAKLLLLHRRNKDQAGVQRLLAALSEPIADENEVNAAASSFLALARNRESPDAQAGEEAEALLKKYLSFPRKRSAEVELDARLKLGSIYLRQRRLKEARGVLAIEPPENPLSPRARGLLRAVQELGKRVDRAEQDTLN